jgi:signal transduction histidine kinase
LNQEDPEMSQARIVFMDPRESLKAWRDGLSASGTTVEVVPGMDQLLGSTDAGADPVPLVVVLDGEAGSGLEPDQLKRFGELAVKAPPVVIALVPDRPRGRAWVEAGASAFIERTSDPADLAALIAGWLRLSSLLLRSVLREEVLRKFFAMYAHDLKNPLSAIAGYCELAIANPQLPADTREDLSKMGRSIELLNAMAQGLLEMVRGTGALLISPRETRLASVVKEAVEMLRLRAGAKGIAIWVRADDPSVVVRIDPARMIEALANVLDNAIRFSPDRSSIEVSISADPKDAWVTIDDEGPGILPQNRERIFDRFTRAAASSPQGNLGLGLSIARDIVELHRGAIRAEPHTPRGTRIAIRIPRCEPAAPAAAPSEAPAAGESLPPIKERPQGVHG